MVRRAREATFMGGAHVFPGGALDPDDSASGIGAVVRWSGDPAETAWRAAALRELAEEVGIVVAVDGVRHSAGSAGALYRRLEATGARLDADALVYVSNWVTPRGLPKRYDTRFYLLEVPADAVVRSDRTEVFDPVWATPRQALTAAAAGEWMVEVPTRAHLEMLAAATDLDAALDAARRSVPTRTEPRLVRDSDGAWTVLLPGDPGFDGAAL